MLKVIFNTKIKLTRVTFDGCDNVCSHVKQKQSYNNHEQIIKKDT